MGAYAGKYGVLACSLTGPGLKPAGGAEMNRIIIEWDSAASVLGKKVPADLRFGLNIGIIIFYRFLSFSSYLFLNKIIYR